MRMGRGRATWAVLAVLTAHVALFGAPAAISQAADGSAGGTVNATVTIAEPAESCLLLSVAELDFGVVDFSSTAFSEPYTVTSCSSASQDIFASGTDADDGGTALWQLVPAVPGEDEFAVSASLDGLGTQALSGAAIEIGSLPPEAERAATHRFTSPPIGSSGAGETVGFDLLWTATVAPTWFRLSESPGNVGDMTFLDADRGYVVGGGGLIAATTDGGATWTSQDSGFNSFLQGVSFVDVNRGWAVGDPVAIRATTDGGTTWVVQDPGVEQGALKDVAFVDAQHGWAVGVGGGSMILATTDGGATWSRQTTGQQGMLEAVSFVDRDHGVAVGGGGLILVTSDGGTTWDQSEPGTSAALWDVQLIDRDRAWAIGADGMLESNDGGQTWSLLTDSPLGHLSSVAFPDPLRGWVSGFLPEDDQQAVMSATTDGGATWTSQSEDVWAGLHRIGNVTFLGANRGWAVGTRFELDGTTILSSERWIYAYR